MVEVRPSAYLVCLPPVALLTLLLGGDYRLEIIFRVRANFNY